MLGSILSFNVALSRIRVDPNTSAFTFPSAFITVVIFFLKLLLNWEYMGYGFRKV